MDERGREGRAPPPRALLSWSSGKDGAFALHALRGSGECEVVGLLTTVTRSSGRISMHGVREELLERQRAALGLPLTIVELPFPCSNAEYERAMNAALGPARRDGIRTVVFGDLFLEDIRAYRESRLRAVGMTGLFPLWGRDTAALARDMIRSGLRARLCCLDPRRLDPTFAGRAFDREFLEALPASVDPCGERGEFHTFVTDLPEFRAPVEVRVGSTRSQDGFLYTDLRAA